MAKTEEEAVPEASNNHSTGTSKATTDRPSSTREGTPSAEGQPESSPEQDVGDKDGKGDGNVTDTTETNAEKKNMISERVTNVIEDKSPQKSSFESISGKVQASSEGKVEAAENEGNTSNKQEKKLLTSGPVVSSTKRTRPPYKYDPEKVTLRFLFANRDGLTVTVECKPGDTVGEVKGQLLSVWPEDLPDCSGGDQLRLICMGKGMLMPDSRTLEDCQVPVFKTHPTPVNVSVRPNTTLVENRKSSKDIGVRGPSTPEASAGTSTDETGQGCGCVIQ